MCKTVTARDSTSPKIRKAPADLVQVMNFLRTIQFLGLSGQQLWLQCAKTDKIELIIMMRGARLNQ